MKLSNLIKELQDLVIEGFDPDVLVEYNLKLYEIPLIGDFEGNVIIYSNQKSS